MRRLARAASGWLLFVTCAVAAALGGACGLGILGVAPDGDASEGGLLEGGALDGAQDGAQDDGSSVPLDDGAVPIFDAALDVNPLNCLLGCEGGTAGTMGCDAGTCVIRCDNNECQNEPVVCPPGIPCAIDCAGQNSCKGGLDCTQASRCAVGCTGQGSCQNNPIDCTGDSCSITCTGQANACNVPIRCDAGDCLIRCLENDTCQNNPIGCTSDSCRILCGSSKNKGTRACGGPINCAATTSCDIQCRANDSCQNGAITAIAGKRADVACLEDRSCNGGILIEAADAGVVCHGPDACQGRTTCDGGKCAAECFKTNNQNQQFCCYAATCVATNTMMCTFTDGGCP